MGQGRGGCVHREGDPVVLGDEVEDGGDVVKVLVNLKWQTLLAHLLGDPELGVGRPLFVHQDLLPDQVVELRRGLGGDGMAGGDQDFQCAFREIYIIHIRAGDGGSHHEPVQFPVAAQKVMENLAVADVLDGDIDLGMGGDEAAQHDRVHG